MNLPPNLDNTTNYKWDQWDHWISWGVQIIIIVGKKYNYKIFFYLKKKKICKEGEGSWGGWYGGEGREGLVTDQMTYGCVVISCDQLQVYALLFHWRAHSTTEGLSVLLKDSQFYWRPGSATLILPMLLKASQF